MQDMISPMRQPVSTEGSAANPAEAFRWLSRAAQQGQPVAEYRLGTLYERGQGVAANPATAASWYEKAANAGNRLAMYNLAVAMANKSLGRQNMPEAARWFSKAAALGLVDAEFNLAVLYERGDGVPQSLLDAYKWYMIAAAAGDNGAQQRAAVLATQLSEADRAAAQKSAQAFKPTPLNRAANVPPEPADLAFVGVAEDPDEPVRDPLSGRRHGVGGLVPELREHFHCGIHLRPGAEYPL